MTQKTVVEIYPDTHERLKTAAKSSGNSVKRFSSLMLDYALDKFQSGGITLKEPEVAEVDPSHTAKKGARR